MSKQEFEHIVNTFRSRTSSIGNDPSHDIRKLKSAIDQLLNDIASKLK